MSINILELDESGFPCRKTSIFLSSDIKGAVLYLGLNFPLFKESFDYLIPRSAAFKKIYKCFRAVVQEFSLIVSWFVFSYITFSKYKSID